MVSSVHGEQHPRWYGLGRTLPIAIISSGCLFSTEERHPILYYLSQVLLQRLSSLESILVVRWALIDACTAGQLAQRSRQLSSIQRSEEKCRIKLHREDTVIIIEFLS